MLLFITSFIIFLVVIYIIYNKLIYIKNYNEDKSNESNALSIFKIRLDQINNINHYTKNIDEIKKEIESNIIQNKYLNDSLNNVIKKLTSTFMVEKKLASYIIEINKKINDMDKRINELKIDNEGLRNSYESLNKENKMKNKPVISLQQDLGSTFINLTNTEKQIIRILITEGAKTSPMIMNAISMTREHTSRLMKKLWQEGYIERDTNSMPFTYRPTKELENRINVQS